MVPRTIAPMLAMLDGTRNPDALRTGFLLRTGIQLDSSQVDAFIKSLDDAFLLDNQRFQGAMAKVMDNYRSGPFRPSSLAGSAYPNNGDELREAFDVYCSNANADGGGHVLKDGDGGSKGDCSVFTGKTKIGAVPPVALPGGQLPAPLGHLLRIETSDEHLEDGGDDSRSCSREPDDQGGSSAREPIFLLSGEGEEQTERDPCR